MITGFSFYKAYLAVKLHFTTSYNAIKYCGKTKAKESDFYVRNDHAIFEKWASKVKNQNEAIELSVANFMVSNEWVHGTTEDGISIYTKWKSTQAALTHFIELDYNVIASFIEKHNIQYANFIQKTPKGNKAPLLQLYLTGKILPDTMVSLDSIHHPFISSWLQEYSSDPLVSREVFKLDKYRPFIKPDYSKLVPRFNSIVLGE